MMALSLFLCRVALARPDSPHLQHVEAFGGPEHDAPSFPVPGPLPNATPGPDKMVYGYLAYWDDDLNAVPWDELSHLAIFSAGATSSGTLTSTDRWDQAGTAVSMAQPYGVRIHLTVTNFDSDSLEALLGNATARDALIDELADWVSDTGAHGVNVDFEGLPYSVKSEMVTFTKDLEAAVGEVFLAVPSVDWNASWDFDELAKYSHFFIMAYAYHYSGSSEAGPNDPLYGGDPWSDYAIDWTIDDYTKQSYSAPADKVLLGLPLYGFRWSVSSNTVPATATSDGSAIFYAEANDEAATYGELWESNSETPYWYDGSRQGWYSNEDSLRLRIQYAFDNDLAGIGFWALNYDDQDSDLWAMIREETTEETTPEDTGDTDDPGPGDTDEPGVTSSYVADAGMAFLAYVGDTVVLNGEASVGPEGQDLQFSWTQVEGPPVQLDDPNAVKPRALVEAPGTIAFELVVGDGTDSSLPDRTHVVVLDPDAGRRHKSACGCGTASPAGWLLLAALPLIRRRHA